MPTRRGRLALVDTGTGEVVEPKPRTPHQFDGQGYTLQSKGDEVPLYSLGLTAAEWAAIDWLREHDAAHAYVKVTPDELAADILCNPTTARKSLSRLVKLGLVLKPSPRASAYQLTPRRYWEGAGSTQATATKRLDPPRVTPDEKATVRVTEKTAAQRERSADAQPRPPRPRRATGEVESR